MWCLHQHHPRYLQDVPALLTPHKAEYIVYKPTQLVSINVEGIHLVEKGQTLPWAATLCEHPIPQAPMERPGWQMGTWQLRNMATVSLPAEPTFPLASCSRKQHF